MNGKKVRYKFEAIQAKEEVPADDYELGWKNMIQKKLGSNKPSHLCKKLKRLRFRFSLYTGLEGKSETISVKIHCRNLEPYFFSLETTLQYIFFPLSSLFKSISK